MTSSPRYPSHKPDCIFFLANLLERHDLHETRSKTTHYNPSRLETKLPTFLYATATTPKFIGTGQDELDGQLESTRTRRTTATANTNTPAKYCSSRCRTQKPGKLDRELEKAFVKLLTAEESRGDEAKKQAKGGKHKKGKNSKGDNRVLVPCSAAEELVFGPNRTSMEGENEEHRSDEEETNEMEQTQAPSESCTSEDMDLSGNIIKDDNHIDGDVLARMSVRSGTRIRPPQSVSEVNGSVGGEKGRAERIHETDAMLEKRKQGQKRAKEREMTKCAARRGVVFGFTVSDEGEKRLCEAVMAGKIVEPSFAKGDWAIRWRE
ncbi:chitinase [Fusarium tjaetaba]|uniref:Chitinase n=1 Tax=Fusarium tjaetaba TaxID=1567544 RepID=A0A8H5RXL8_9HYPO|nr:chitinase [Fusarium tjaetaba]KAF5640026.1 chitinase [Fusarium tjaetaba]